MAAKASLTPQSGLAPTDYAMLAAWLRHTAGWWDRPAYPRREYMRGLMLRLMVLARQADPTGTNTRGVPRKPLKSPG